MSLEAGRRCYETIVGLNSKQIENCVELIGELKAARKKKWIPFMEVMRMKQLAEEKYQEITRKELLKYNMFEKLKLTFALKKL